MNAEQLIRAIEAAGGELIPEAGGELIPEADDRLRCRGVPPELRHLVTTHKLEIVHLQRQWQILLPRGIDQFPEKERREKQRLRDLGIAPRLTARVVMEIVELRGGSFECISPAEFDVVFPAELEHLKADVERLVPCIGAILETRQPGWEESVRPAPPDVDAKKPCSCGHDKSRHARKGAEYCEAPDHSWSLCQCEPPAHSVNSFPPYFIASSSFCGARMCRCRAFTSTRPRAQKKRQRRSLRDDCTCGHERRDHCAKGRKHGPDCAPCKAAHCRKCDCQ